jgi:hypothetical protein
MDALFEFDLHGSWLPPVTGLPPWSSHPYERKFLHKSGSITETKERSNMLFTIAIILLVLWLLGLITTYTLGGWIHLLLVLAIIAFVVRLIMGTGRPGGPPPV